MGTIENVIKCIDIKGLGLKYKNNEKLYQDIDSLQIKPENEFNPKYNHFLLQLKNLVQIKSVDKIIESNRLFQIAYNLGQLKYNYIKNIISEEMKKVINDNMDIFCIQKFVDDETIDKLDPLFNNVNIINNGVIDIYITKSTIDFSDETLIKKIDQKGGSNINRSNINRLNNRVKVNFKYI